MAAKQARQKAGGLPGSPAARLDFISASQGPSQQYGARNHVFSKFRWWQRARQEEGPDDAATPGRGGGGDRPWISEGNLEGSEARAAAWWTHRNMTLALVQLDALAARSKRALDRLAGQDSVALHRLHRESTAGRAGGRKEGVQSALRSQANLVESLEGMEGLESSGPRFLLDVRDTRQGIHCSALLTPTPTATVQRTVTPQPQPQARNLPARTPGTPYLLLGIR